ncbi:MAG: site-specific integrase [Ilumatobacteraceae bacterium]
MEREASSRERPPAGQQSTLEVWLSSQLSANTRAAYRCDLDAFGRWCARQGAIPLTADTATLVAFQAAREAAGDSDSTLRRRWSALSSFYDFAVDRDLRAVNPVVGVDRPKVLSGDPSPTVRLSAEAVADCRAVAAALDPRLEALVALLVCDGLKVAEVLALDIDHVASRRRAMTITVRRRGESKRVVLDPDSARAVRRCVGKRRSGPVFVNERSSRSDTPHRLTRFGADHLIRQLRTDDTTEQVTANALRRFHIDARQSSGEVLADVRDRAGLAHVRSVKRYTPAPSSQSNTTADAGVGDRRVRPHGKERST